LAVCFDALSFAVHKAIYQIKTILFGSFDGQRQLFRSGVRDHRSKSTTTTTTSHAGKVQKKSESTVSTART
jgi:hypothetical protein